jgi:hypothetical protein
VAEVSGKISVVGGFRGDRELGNLRSGRRPLEPRGAAIPRALHHASPVGINGKLYIIGGFVEGWTAEGRSARIRPGERSLATPCCPQREAHWGRRAGLSKTRTVGGIGWRGRNTARGLAMLPPIGGRRRLSRRRAITWRSLR